MAADNSALTSEKVAETAQANWLFERLPAWVVDTFSAEQKEAIHKVIDDPSWKRPPVNIRFTVPIIHKRFYITVVSGEEKRSSERRRRDRHSYPLRTAANVFFFVGIATVFYMVAVVGLAIQSAIIEF
jgi:hypothetical protein